MPDMICSICHKPIGDMCQAHYGDDGGPICTRCLGYGSIELDLLLDNVMKISDESSYDWAERGCW